MAHVAFQAGDRLWWVGQPSLIVAFASTVAVRLESGRLGSRFPRLTGDLYDGRLDAEHVGEARSELATIVSELAELPPSELVWNAEDRSLRPPWGDDIADTITSLANYFWTADGEDMLDVLDQALASAAEQHVDLGIKSESQIES